MVVNEGEWESKIKSSLNISEEKILEKVCGSLRYQMAE
jgi:hypothetical protein